MSDATSDRNLLAGVIALQMELIDASALAKAMRTWATSPEQQLEKILLQHGDIDERAAGTISDTVQLRLHAFENDAQKSLASFGKRKQCVQPKSKPLESSEASKSRES